MDLNALERLIIDVFTFLGCYGSIIFKLADNKDMHSIFDKFKFWPDCTRKTELGALERLKMSNRLEMGEYSDSSFSRLFSSLRTLQLILITYLAEALEGVLWIKGYWPNN